MGARQFNQASGQVLRRDIKPTFRRADTRSFVGISFRFESEDNHEIIECELAAPRA